MSAADVRTALYGVCDHVATFRLFQTEDHREGAKSFLEKREPVVRGRRRA
ncbi:MAG: hypothetical protein WDN03_16935 [Rhizomicrobium sp.]